jgi:hypothetical protein
MDNLRSAPPAHAVEALDEDDPHAGDDLDWSALDQAAALLDAVDPQPLLFWRGLLLGLLVSLIAWCVLAALVFGLFASSS